MDITKISTMELYSDLYAGATDVIVCVEALNRGILNYSGGGVFARLGSNIEVMKKIMDELKRRQGDK